VLLPRRQQQLGRSKPYSAGRAGRVDGARRGRRSAQTGDGCGNRRRGRSTLAAHAGLNEITAWPTVWIFSAASSGCYVELFFQLHHQFDGVQRIGAQIVDERRIGEIFSLSTPSCSATMSVTRSNTEAHLVVLLINHSL